MADWFRSWHGAPTDPKWLGIARRAGVAPGIAVAVAWALMDRASQSGDRGSIEGYDADGMACFFGCEPEQVEAIVSAMRDKGVIADWRFTSWEKRQPKREDDSSQRVRAHRERKEQHQERAVTQCNAPDTDTDTDTDITIPDGMDAVPAPPQPVYADASHELWGEGPQILEGLGVAKSRIRPMIGKWCRDAGDDHAAVLAAIQRARDGRVQDPISWITRAIPTTGGQAHGRNDRNSGQRRLTGTEQRIAGLAAAAAKLADQRLPSEAPGEHGAYGGPTLLLRAMSDEPEIPF